uniref:C2H2-type domain-containing protein n=1 Tax=Anopheles triannulatus TaxID=58253 RepID=A0A2M4A108_9DIPT
MDVPSMVQRSGDQLIVRRVVSGEQVILGNYIKSEQSSPEQVIDDVQRSPLPQCRVKRNYTCSHCSYCSQNPREYLTHLRDTHGEKIVINECQRCLYASRHYQKLVRHMKMVHGCTVDALAAAPPASPADRSELPETTRRSTVKRERLQPWSGRRKKLRNSTLDNSTLFQQLVASGLTDLLQAVQGESWSFASADNRYVQDALKVEMDNTENITKSLDEHTNKMRKSMEDTDSSPRKRNRPIPNLIPLAASSPVSVRSEKELLKPVPMSTLMPPEPKDQPKPPVDFPIDLASSRISINLDTHTKCTFCELSYNSTFELANHIATAHKEDLIASLLQKSIDDSKQSVFLQTDTDSASSDMWKTLLESSLCPPESAPKGAECAESSAKASVAEDDDVEIMENKSETYCGVETAPGYGEVTNTIPAGQAKPPGVVKKVFKCPHCSFWASTASRFHVHIVGHLNKKPFECSLCSYRSNWRWDITKHIRLKTIRDPSHKNATVLMNDETGRRNYTKYNKYITLMQITDNSKTLGGSAVSDLITACNIDLQAIANMADFKLLMHDGGGKQPSEEVDSTGQTPTPTVEMCDLKCQICDYRGTSKEDLMLHLANSHISLGSYSLEDIDNTGESDPVVERGSSKPKNCTATTVSNSGTPTPSTSFSSLSKPTANTSHDSSTNGTLTTSSGAGERACLAELGDRLGEGDNGSQKVAMPTWRHNAPYRCGHCHQVSNWKHVIQRHCRLKHNGNVFIELTNTEREDGSEIDGQSRGGKQGGQTSFYVVDEGSSMSVPPLAPFSMDEPGCSASSLEPIVEINDKDTADLIGLDNILSSTMTLPHDGFSLDHPDHDASQGGMQLQCVSCDFHAESLNQLTEHLQLHIVNGTPGGQSTVDTDGDNIEILAQGTVPTCLYYCPKCPARFFHESHIVLHLEHHESNESQSAEVSICHICSYRSATEEELEQHSEVHTAQYNKNTTNLQLFLDENSIYRKPTLALLLRNGEQVLAVDPSTAAAAAAAGPATNGGRSSSSSSSAKPSDVASSSRKMKRLKPDHHHSERTRGNTEEKTPAVTKPTILLCEYCDNTFDGEVALNAHVRSHFTAVLAPSAVTYYASLNNTLNKENKFELVVSGTQTTMPLRYVYDNGRRKEWSTFSKSESVLLKL